jgi:hypothetical protein
MAAIAKMVASTIRNQLELIKINEDYEKLLKPQIGKTTKDFIDAICVYITNQRLQKCKPAKETSSKSAVVKNTEDLLRSYFEHNSKIDMLAYKPTYSVDKMFGGADNAAGGAIPGLLNSIKATGSIDPTKLTSSIPNSVSTDGLNAALPTVDVKGLANNMIDAPPSTDLYALITSTKAKDVMDFYTTEVISKLQCNDDMHGYINDHIIQPVFAVASKHIAEVGSHHLTDLAKTTTEFHLYKCVLLIKGQLDTFGSILNIVSIQPANNTIPNIIIPQYIHLLFELFVYSEYGLIVDMPIGINRDGIQAYITKLKSFNVQIDNYIKDDKYPEGIMSMNGLKLPESWNTDEDNEADKNKMITKELVIAEFKKLFKPVVANAKGGRRRSRTKKHKPRHLPVTKHCSRRKRP